MKLKLRIIYFFSIFFICSLICCSQKNKKQENMDYIEKMQNIHKKVKKYDYNPIYQLKVNKNLCTYEIYVNDILVDYSFSIGQTAGEQSIDIPQYILKSGKQSIRYKVYPKAIEDGVLEEMLDLSAMFSLRIVHGEYYKESFDSFKEDLNLTLPKLETVLPFFEFFTTFQATVPYELKGWTEGVDLSKENPEKLEKEVLKKMDEIKKIYEDKDIERIAKLQYAYLQEYYQAMYFNEAKHSLDWIEKINEDLIDIYKYVLDVNDMKVVIMGNNKVVALLQDNGEFRNDSAFLGISEDSYNFYKFLFYRPKAGAPLEVIR